jgi:hypothetical protein
MPPEDLLDINILDFDVLSFEALCQDLNFSRTQHQPFSKEVVIFFQNLSKALIQKAQETDGLADALALGYWLRPANLKKMQNHFTEVSNSSPGLRVPAGLVFHIAPSNVEVLFAYSWALSTLAGCHSIVKVSSKFSDLTRTIVQLINSTAISLDLERSWIFVSTPKENKTVLAKIIEDSDTIVVWGGNKTVNSIREYVRKPTSTEVVFPDRESISVINSSEYLTCSDREKAALASRLAKDISSFGQQACSSPRLLSWIGPKLSDFEISNFHMLLASAIEQRGYIPTAYEVSSRRVFLHRLALTEPGAIHSTTYGSLQVVNILGNIDFRIGHPGNGLLLETQYATLGELENSLKFGDQTISQFGFGEKDWEAAILKWGEKVPNRIVPIGQSLDFHFIWDGHDLIQEFTRNVVIGA